MSTATQLLTADDLWEMSRNGQRFELVRGELRTMPPAGGEHGVTTVNLTGPLWHHIDVKELGALLAAETGFIIATDPDTVRAADIAFVAKHRIPASGIPTKFWPGYPDLAVEVISPGDTLQGVEDKVAEWLNAGTRLVWVVNPRRRTVTVYRSLQSARILTDQEELDGEDVIPGFRIPVSRIFR
jgi:Uma2 family endonuclease